MFGWFKRKKKQNEVRRSATVTSPSQSRRDSSGDDFLTHAAVYNSFDSSPSHDSSPSYDGGGSYDSGGGCDSGGGDSGGGGCD